MHCNVNLSVCSFISQTQKYHPINCRAPGSGPVPSQISIAESQISKKERPDHLSFSKPLLLLVGYNNFSITVKGDVN